MPNVANAWCPGPAQTYGRDRQSYGDVDLNAVIEEATPHCANMMSVHVFAVKDEGNPPAETPVLMDATRYYVVALLNDGRSILVWQVALTDDTYARAPSGMACALETGFLRATERSSQCRVVRVFVFSSSSKAF
jgi:hypothetical protein